MYSQSPVAAVELVVNGIVHRIKLVPDHARKYRGQLRLTLKNSSWIAARWLAEDTGNCSITHTSPLYFWNGDQPLPVRRADAAYLLDRVEKLAREIRTGKSETGSEPTTVISDTDALRREQLQYAERARKIYRKKLAGEIARARK